MRSALTSARFIEMKSIKNSFVKTFPSSKKV